MKLHRNLVFAAIDSLQLIFNEQKQADKVVVSIFVNPLQFNDKADLAAYPRTTQQDLAKLSDVNCDMVFMPDIATIYPKNMADQTIVSVPNMDDKLCGQNRPGHFDGVATIVNKLFNLVDADIALFGEKDYQQVLVIKTMVKDLAIDIKIATVATYRDKNGLALSSRNQYLSAEELAKAPAIYQQLLQLKAQIEQGEQHFSQLQTSAIAQLNMQGFKVDYVDIRCADNLAIAKSGDKSLRILIAARLGTARLIDNIACDLA